MLSQENKERYMVNEERVKHWISVGAQPTERVAKILGHLNIIEKPAIANRPKKSQPKKK